MASDLTLRDLLDNYASDMSGDLQNIIGILNLVIDALQPAPDGVALECVTALYGARTLLERVWDRSTSDDRLEPLFAHLRTLPDYLAWKAKMEAPGS